MEVKKDIMVTCSEGEFEIRMGKALTSIYFKNRELFVIRANEIPTLIGLLERGIEEQRAFVESIKAS